MQITVYTDLPPEQVLEKVHDILESCTHPNQEDFIYKSFRVALFKPIFNAYDVKSRGGTDRMGNRWQRLSKSRLKNKKKNRHLILVENGRLLGAVKALASFYGIDQTVAFGFPSGGSPHYTAGEQTHIEETSDSIVCEVMTPYAHFQDTDQSFSFNGNIVFKPGRPLWPDKLGIWFTKATSTLAKLIAQRVVNEFSRNPTHSSIAFTNNVSSETSGSDEDLFAFPF